MTEISFKSAGVSARTINLTGPTAIQPTGIPAGVIGPSLKGPAYVPVTVATSQDFNVIFGNPTSDFNYGPLAVTEWLRNQRSATYIRVLGVGNGQARTTNGTNIGKVVNAGFVVGDQQPAEDGRLADNSYANAGGDEGRTYFLGCIMSQSLNSSIFSDAALPAQGNLIVRAVLMAPSGVLLRLSSSIETDNGIASTTLGTDATAKGSVTGSLNLASSRQEFVMLLNGHKGTNALYPLAITASFDIEAPNYFGNIFNTDPYKLEEAGHLLYAEYKIHPSLAVPTGSGVITGSAGGNVENIAFLITGSAARNLGSATQPNFENFEDRFRTAKSPWVTSQKFGGSSQNLFRIHALDDGAYPNSEIKFSIENITPSNTSDPYGTFDLVVRDFSDNDKAKIVIEAFRGLSLNPGSDKYVAKVVGDYYTYLDLDQSTAAQKLITVGDYPNNSKYIRVEVDSKVASAEVDPSALPFGVRGMPHLVTSGSALAAFADSSYYPSVTNLFSAVTQMPVPFRQNLNRGTGAALSADPGLYWGVQFEQKISATELNSSTVPEASLQSFASYFPDFQTGYVNFSVFDNAGAPDGANGIIDCDRFNNNGFSLENLRVPYVSGSTTVDTVNVVSWSYVRQGGVTTNTSNFTRALTVADLADPTVRRLSKFNFCLQGGFDGVRIFNKDTRNMTDLAIYQEMQHSNRGTINGPTVTSYNKALDLISDATEVDVQLLAIPGVRHPIITDRALQVVESRFDALYLMDIQQKDVSNNLVSSSNQIVSVPNTVLDFTTRGVDSSFGAVYFPDVMIQDSVNNAVRQVPPSVAVLGAFGKNDSVSYPWFAPAGFTRGALESTLEASVQLSRLNLDDLYSSRINPLTSFPGSGGVVVWGQKTVLAKESALERVNVRRLLIDLRRQVKRIANRIVFEQGLPETLARFSQLVTPILKRVQDQNGVDRYLVKIDTSTTTQADFENKTIRGKIYIQPTRTLEFLSIDFVLSNPGTI
jgi:hypothetical protein